MAHGLVLGGIGLNLRCHLAPHGSAQHPGLLTEAQELDKQTLEGIEVAAPELTDAAVVRLLVGDEHPECQILVAGKLDLAAGDDAVAVGVEQQHRHHPPVEPLLPARIVALGWDQDGGEIQHIHQVQQEIHLMVIRERFARRWRQQVGLLRLPWSEGLCLAPIFSPRSIAATAIWVDSGASVERLAWFTRARLLGRQAFPGHPPIHHELAYHPRSPAATDAGPLSPGGLALDSRHPTPSGRPSLPGQRCRCAGHAWTADLNLLRLDGFQSIRSGLQAVCHNITELLAMARRQLAVNTC